MLELQASIIARLKDPVFPEVGSRVHPRDEFESVAQAGMQDTTIFVRFARMVQVASTGQARSTAWDFEWWVVTAFRSAQQTQDGLGGGLGKVSPLLRGIASRLQGWKPDLSSHNPLEMISPPDPEYIKGLSLIPLAFRCRQFIS